MELLSIKRAFERRLNQIAPAIATATPGVKFDPPTDAPYQRIQLVPRTPDNPTLGDKYYREVGEFQVFLAYPLGEGEVDALTRAGLVRDQFDRGTSMIEDGIRIHIIRTPQIAGSVVASDRLVIPVIIEYIAEVNKV